MRNAPSNADFSALGWDKIPTPDAMRLALIEQHRQLADKDQQLANQETQIQQQQNLIALLEEQLRLKNVRQYGASSEKNPQQMDWLADEAEQLADGKPDPEDGEIDPEEQDPHENQPKRKNRGRKGLNENLPRIQKHIELSEEQRQAAIRTFFVKVKEELDITPATAQVIEIYQEKAVYLDEDGEQMVVGAQRPAHPLGKAIVSVNLLSWLVIAKYADGLPLYRIEKILARYGGEITRTTLANWIIRLSVTLQPLVERLESHLMRFDYIQGDETRLQVLKEPGMSPTGDKWMWLLRGGPPGGRSVVLFNYDKSRAKAVADRLLKGFEGRYFQSDGYAAYDGPCKAKSLVHLGCWDHARRRVVEAIKAQPKAKKEHKPSVAMVMLSKIDALYRLEKRWKTLDDDERYEQRQEQAVKKLAELKHWLTEKQHKVAPGTLIGKAIDYTLNQWDHLVRYCEHGQLRMNNILVENAIRPFAVGRKSWLFSNSPQGAKASAVMFTLIETSKANGVEPSRYMQYVLEQIVDADTDEALEALMPWNMS